MRFHLPEDEYKYAGGPHQDTINRLQDTEVPGNGELLDYYDILVEATPEMVYLAIERMDDYITE